MLFESISCPTQQTATIRIDYCQEDWPASGPGSLSHCDPRVYNGTEVAMTRCGIPCQNWALDEPHSHHYNNVGNHNYCRNPNGEQMAWCYTNVAEQRWDYCDVCGGTTDCSVEPPTQRVGCDVCDGSTQPRDGSTYTGTANTTVNGIACQVWSSDLPHSHGYNSVGDHNFCRNPDNDSGGTWCYTTDPNVRWDYCDQRDVCPAIPGNSGVSWSTQVMSEGENRQGGGGGVCGVLRRGRRPLSSGDALGCSS